MKMLSKKIYYLIIALLVVFAVSVFLLSEYRDVFDGDCVKEDDRFTVDFLEMNRTETHTLELSKGDVLNVDFSLERGRTDLVIGIDGEEPIYRGDDITSGVFELIVPQDGVYTVTVSARHARGTVGVFLNRLYLNK